MALGKCYTTALDGVLANVVTVEANIGAGLPGTHVVGLADTAITESRERMRTAVTNSQLRWPKTKIIISMSPASMPKSGSHFDLPMALAILVAAMGPEADLETGIDGASPAGRLASCLVLGELGLDGTVRGVPGVIPALLSARKHGYRTVLIPPDNAAEAALISDMNVLVTPTLERALAWVCGATPLESAAAAAGPGAHPRAPRTPLDFRDVAGQAPAKKAAEIAAAGGHHLMMVGPPGSGKSMIAARLPSILPPLSIDESVETTAVHSLAGSAGTVIGHAPFIAPHSSVTRAGLLGGGGARVRPGAVSLAHNGVLFLDEVSEIPAAFLDGLRAPLEEGIVRVSRARREVSFPARFQLVMAANPCRCGADQASRCRCRSADRQNYLRNISGPLRDRLDIILSLNTQGAVIGSAEEEPSAVIAERVAAARERSAARWRQAGLDARTNAAVPTFWMRREYPATEDAMETLKALLLMGDITQRGIDRALKVAWTLADLAGRKQPDLDLVSQALELRQDSTL